MAEEGGPVAHHNMESDSTKRTIKVVTHNVYGHYITLAPNKEYRIRELMRKLAEKQPDILLLQELFVFNVPLLQRSNMRDAAIAEAKERLGLPFSTFGPSYWLQDSGLVSISRYPIITSDYKIWRPWHDVGTGKGWLRMRVEWHKTPINFISLHLDAHKQSDRAEQLQELKRTIEEIGFENPIVVAGDFNINRLSNEYRAVEKALHPLSNAVPMSVCEKGTHRTYSSVIDFMFVSPHFEVESSELLDLVGDDGSFVSDHRGLLLTLSLRGSK